MPAPAPRVVLEAKLHPPVLHPEHISRPRLRQRLDDGITRKLTLVSAAAGFGKSTMLAEWCAHSTSGRRFAWLSLDDLDNDPAIFWTYILHALRRLEPGCFDAGLEALERPGASLTRSVLPYILNDLWSLDRPIVLILDDFHEVTSPECHDSLDFFLRRMPPALHLVVATRADPSLRLPAWRALGDLSELRAAELRFSDEEVETFLNGRLGLGLGHDDLGRLTARTECWPAGLYLAALSLRERPDTSAFIADFTGHSRHVVDYLGGEVLDRLPEDALSFLLQTSVLDTLSPSLCDAVTGRMDSAAALTDLVRTNQFLIALDDRGAWYRYHHLFADILRVELNWSRPELVPELHRRAAHWYRSAGDVVAAMQHALAADDHNLMSDLFIDYAQPLQANGRLATVEAWASQLPTTAISADPSLALALAWIGALLNQPKAEVERLLVIAEAGESHRPPPLHSHSPSAEAAVIRACFLFDDVGRAVQAGQLAVQSETDPNTLSYLLAWTGLGHALYFAGQPDEARPILEAVLAAPLRDRQTTGLSHAMAVLALISLERGEATRAEALARQSVQICEAKGLAEHPTVWTAYLALGMVLCRRGLCAEAEAVLAQGLEPRLSGFGDWRFQQALALLALAPVRFARGHVQAARTLIGEARVLIAACPDPGILTSLLETTERSLHRLPSRPTGMPEELTEAELRVLRMMAGDLSQREIGRELYLSLNTIKTHTRAIYGKLGASSRREAITRARDLELIA
ncbi:MAG: LuxR C-terminal-related transcriptional regulator [Dehalococcoidia bacterium]